MLDDFSRVSGLRLNDKKTEALWIGASIGNDKIQLSGKELKWAKDKVKSLGLWISTDRELSASLNYNEKLEKVKEILRCWKYCQLTLIGKITVRGIKWSLRAFASMRAVRLFLRARAVINFLMRAASTLEIKTGEQ